MKTLIITYSYHHNNTLKVAHAINEVLNGTIVTPAEALNINLSEYNLIGFGAGIDSGKHYKELLDYAQTIDSITEKSCFIFSTSAVQGDKKVYKDHSALRKIVQSKGYDVVGEFSCKGFNTNLFLKYIGGMNKNNPNENDLSNAKMFANNLINI